MFTMIVFTMNFVQLLCSFGTGCHDWIELTICLRWKQVAGGCLFEWNHSEWFVGVDQLDASRGEAAPSVAIVQAAATHPALPAARGCQIQPQRSSAVRTRWKEILQLGQTGSGQDSWVSEEQPQETGSFVPRGHLQSREGRDGRQFSWLPTQIHMQRSHSTLL